MSPVREDYEENRRNQVNATRMTVLSDVGNAGGRTVKLLMDDNTMTNHVTRRSRIHAVFFKDEVTCVETTNERFMD